MMTMPVILAHGALGIWDEVIFICVACVFLGMMGLSWIRSRDELPEDAAAPDQAIAPAAPPLDDNDSPDHFRLQ